VRRPVAGPLCDASTEVVRAWQSASHHGTGVEAVYRQWRAIWDREVVQRGVGASGAYEVLGLADIGASLTGELGDHHAAIAILETSLSHPGLSDAEPWSVDMAWFALATALLIAGDSDRAAPVFRSLLAPDTPPPERMIYRSWHWRLAWYCAQQPADAPTPAWLVDLAVHVAQRLTRRTAIRKTLPADPTYGDLVGMSEGARPRR
jgi:hypothetical protein